LRLGSFVATATFIASAARADGPALTPTKLECVTANENAQTLRQNHRLLAAQAELVRCAVSTCPTAVREDCENELRSIAKAIPKVRFYVTDASGRALLGVNVSIDGSASERDDGLPTALDPGEHMFRFAATGFRPILRSVMLEEGVADRRETIALSTARDVPTVDLFGRQQKQVAYGLAGGAGILVIVGTIVGLKAKSTYDDATSQQNCPGGLSHCNQVAIDGVSSAHGQATAATVSFIFTSVLLAAAIGLFVTAPNTPAQARGVE
jgi:hypothetical protein